MTKEQLEAAIKKAQNEILFQHGKTRAFQEVLALLEEEAKSKTKKPATKRKAE